MSRTLVKLLGLKKVYDQKGDRVSKNDKSCHICSLRPKGVFLVTYENYGTLSLHD